jgi:hypothetical protein
MDWNSQSLSEQAVCEGPASTAGNRPVRRHTSERGEGQGAAARRGRHGTIDPGAGGARHGSKRDIRDVPRGEAWYGH